MNIVHVVAKYPPALGGMEKVVEELATAQAAAGLGVRAITSDRGAKNIKNYNDRVPVTRLRSIEILTTPLMPRLFSELLHLPKDTIVHVHVAQAFTPEVVWMAAKRHGFPFVAHVHLDVGPGSRFGFLLKLYKPLVLQRVLRAAASVVVFTEEQRTALHAQYHVPLSRIAVIPNGVGARFVAEKPRAKAHEPLRLLFVGRLCKQKNVAFLLHALEGVSEKFATRIVGEGELRQELETLVWTLQLQNVTFVGRKDGAALLKEYSRADAMVLPSEREGMSLVTLEALAAGLPLIATDVTGNRDVVRNNNNGLLVPLNNIAKLRAALLRLHTEPALYKHLSAQALESSKAYRWETVERQFASLYKDVPKGAQP